ncbi:hypothetical protein [Enterococcus sp.]|nr:hypothetical protein [Enterococcus sp.]
MPIKISDLIIPKEKLEKEFRLVNVARWQKDGQKTKKEPESLSTKDSSS